MKNLIIITIFLILGICSCKKDDTAAKTTGNCNIDMALLKDITWMPPSSTSFAQLKFQSNGDYYEGSTLDGTWAVSNGCDSIYITRSSSSFFYRVMMVKNDSLKLRNPVFGDIYYTH
jgi:hypothetical protein